MDWNKVDIDTRPFTFYELENESRSLSGYHVFLKVGAHEYNLLSEMDKVTYVLAVSNFDSNDVDVDGLLPFGFDACDFPIIRTLITWWIRLDATLKDDWAERAKRLNSRPYIGQFVELPSELACLDITKTQNLLRDWLRDDLAPLLKSVHRAIRNKNQRDLYRKTVKIPYGLQVEQQVWHTGNISSLLSHTLFGGDNFSTFTFNELISTNCDPFIFHVASRSRMVEIFSIDDCCLSTLTDHQFKEEYYLTSFGILQNKQGMCIKSYGWVESESHIDFMFNDTANTTKIISFVRPIYLKDEGYVCDIEVVDGYTLVHYSPAAVYVSTKNSVNFKILAAKVCIDENGRIVDKKSS